MPGWISIHRKIQSHWVWEDKPFSKGQAWIDLLMLANHEDSKFLLGSQLIDAKRGEVITSELKLMSRWGWSNTKVRAFLGLLEKDSMIIKKADSKKSTITLTNYSVWQDTESAKEVEKKCEESAEKVQKNTINNSNNSNNSNNKYIVDFFESIWKLYPKKEGKGEVSKTQKEKLYKIGLEEMTRAINRYIHAKSDTDKKFWKNGSTFFNSGYVDYLDANYHEPKREGTYAW